MASDHDGHAWPDAVFRGFHGWRMRMVTSRRRGADAPAAASSRQASVAQSGPASRAAHAALLALATARTGAMSAADTAAVMIEFLVRNGGIMALVILGILQRPELIAVPTACVLLQSLLAPVLVAALRRWGNKLAFQA